MALPLVYKYAKQTLCYFFLFSNGGGKRRVGEAFSLLSWWRYLAKE